jgi:hypothetical protein
MSHPSMMVVRAIIPDIGIFIGYFYGVSIEKDL